VARYMLLIYSDAKGWETVSPEENEAVFGEYFAFTQSLIDAGVMVNGDPLVGVSEAKTVAKGGSVTDGPFAETAEWLAGYYAVDVPTIDDAIAWAAKLPGVDRGFDRIEVRQIPDLPTMPQP
jgi:hypothetical protein